MVDDTSRKLATAIKTLQRDVKRLLSGRWLENTAVRGGRLRFIGGVLRLDSGALLDLIGQWRFRGNGAITGDVVAEGKWTQNGDWEFNGDGDLAGDVDLTGNFNLTGKFESTGIRIEGGKIYVGTGAGQIVIDGATGTITVGGMTIDPADGGKVTFPGGAQLRADVGTGIQMQIGNVKISAQANSASIGIGTRGIIINSGGFQFTSVPTKTATATGLPAGAAHLDSGGNLFRIV